MVNILIIKFFKVTVLSYKYTTCSNNVKKYESIMCLFFCPGLCDEDLYDTERTQVTWPHSAFLDMFYESVIKDTITPPKEKE